MFRSESTYRVFVLFVGFLIGTFFASVVSMKLSYNQKDVAPGPTRATIAP